MPNPSHSGTDPVRVSSSPARLKIWAGISDQTWNDWRWQLRHRLSTVDELRQVIDLTPEEEEGVSAQKRFRLAITPYFASLMDPTDPSCPIRRQVIPTGRELRGFRPGVITDSLNEEAHSPVPGLVHRYPDRVLMLVTTQCASYCRYCTRSRIVGDPRAQFDSTDYEAQIDYIANTPQIRDVLISGGIHWCFRSACSRLYSPSIDAIKST